MLSKRILPTIGILLLLLTSCSGDDLRSSDSEEREAIQMHFNLQPMEMEAIASAATKAVGKNEALSVAMGLSGKESTTSTRNSTGIDESVINEVCVFQFGGTLPTSTLVAKEYYSSPNTANMETTLTESSSDQTVYVVVNVGDVTGNYTIGTTTIANFQTSTLSFATESSVTSGTNLPMIGTYTGTTMPGLYTVSLTRMVAKLGFTCNVSLTNTSDAFTLTSVRLYSIANVAQMNTPTGSYPANSTTDASKYTNYTAESYMAGNTLTWYIPENLRGTVSAITTEQDKNKKNAPAYSTYIEVEGIYTPSGETAEYVTYRLYPGANMTTSFDIARNTYYSISMTIKGMNETDSRVLLPENLSINNAGTQITANCYIANDGNQNYKFKATVMGNGATTAATTYGAQIIPSTLSPTAALLIWETGAAGNVVETGSVKLVGGYVRFKTSANTANGNALIGVTDGSNILWSWHIWKTAYTPNTDYDTYTTRTLSSPSLASRSVKMMKCHLGTVATSANWNGNISSAGDLGLFYQWGRKDPFMGPSGWTYARAITSNNSSYPWYDGYGNSAIANTIVSSATTSIAYSIKHPTSYFTGTGVGDSPSSDWIYATTRSGQCDNLWGNPNTPNTVPNTTTGSKSIYDPCPPGWRVPPADCFTGFSTTGSSTSTVSQFVVSGIYNNGWFFYTSDAKIASSYWPSSGYRTTTTGQFAGITYEGFCWSSSSFSTGYAGADDLYFASSVLNITYGVARATAFPVRCVQE